MKYKNITVAGSGVLGSQIAFQVAYKGFSVSLYDISNDVLALAKERLAILTENYKQDLSATQQAVDMALGRISSFTDLSKAVADSDLVIEAIPEVVSIKTEFYEKLGKLAPEPTVFATNSSTLLPSQFADITGRPERFLALHFANSIWKNTTAEVMKHPTTDEQVFEDVIEFAKAIGMVALPLRKEQPGYILNSLLIPFLVAAQLLLLDEIADVETIDRAWMLATGAPEGPFAILDTVWINTAHNIVLAKAAATSDPKLSQLAHLLKTEYLDKGNSENPQDMGFIPIPTRATECRSFFESRKRDLHSRPGFRAGGY